MCVRYGCPRRDALPCLKLWEEALTGFQSYDSCMAGSSDEKCVAIYLYLTD